MLQHCLSEKPKLLLLLSVCVCLLWCFLASLWPPFCPRGVSVLPQGWGKRKIFFIFFQIDISQKSWFIWLFRLFPYILCKTKYQSTKLSIYSKNLGLAFQIADDLLDLKGDEFKLGKPVKQDLIKNTPNFVNLLGEEKARKKEIIWKQN